MQTREIPRDEWQGFLDDFSRQHEGESVTVEVLAGEMGDQIIVKEWPLKGITYDGESSIYPAISVIAGDERPARDLNHVIASPTKLLIAESDDGAPQGIKIESESDPPTLVSFHGAASPEMNDRY